MQFDIKVTKSFTRPLPRIINEGLRIKNSEKGSLLNSKNEYFGPAVKRKVVENQLECEECGNKVNNNYNLRKHKRSHHKNEDRYGNPLRGKRLNADNTTEEHLKTHEQNNIF